MGCRVQDWPVQQPDRRLHSAESAQHREGQALRPIDPLQFPGGGLARATRGYRARICHLQVD